MASSHQPLLCCFAALLHPLVCVCVYLLFENLLIWILRKHLCRGPKVWLHIKMIISNVPS